MSYVAERITVDPEQCGGSPCIRGMRIRVSDVLDLLESGLTVAQILEEMPDLESEDIQASLRFVGQPVDEWSPDFVEILGAIPDPIERPKQRALGKLRDPLRL
jgi:uncharacterized protein (DUF433 family)